MLFKNKFFVAAISLLILGVSVAHAETTPSKDTKTEKASPVVQAVPAHDDNKDKKASDASQAKDDAVPASKGAAQLRSEIKVDIKNLPKNLTSLLPIEGDVFILEVGETKLLTAARPRKCLLKEPQTFDEVKLRLPISDLISYSDGGTTFSGGGAYERNSEKCGGAVPARAIFATGIKKGTQKLVILGVELNIIVK